MIGGCDFAYIADDSAVVTSWTKTGDSITIAGTGLPVSGMTISFGPRNCIVSSASTTQITCSLDAPALAGTHSVQIVKPFGHIGGSLSQTEVIPVTITAVSPASLYQAGGQTVVISGTGFPKSLAELASTTFSLTVGGSSCAISSVSSTQIFCQSNSIDSGNANIQININGQTATQAFSVTPVDL